MSGGGCLPTAMHLEPGCPLSPSLLTLSLLGFMDHPDALERWLEHFDSMRGLPICIVDMPPAHVLPSSCALPSLPTIHSIRHPRGHCGRDSCSVKEMDSIETPFDMAKTQNRLFTER
jgi:hypothetical protein